MNGFLWACLEGFDRLKIWKLRIFDIPGLENIEVFKFKNFGYCRTKLNIKFELQISPRNLEIQKFNHKFENLRKYLEKL